MYGPVISEFSTKLTLSETSGRGAAVTVDSPSKRPRASVHWSVTAAQCGFRRWVRCGPCGARCGSQLALNHNILTCRYTGRSCRTGLDLLLSKS